MKKTLPKLELIKSPTTSKESLSYPLSPVSAVRSVFKKSKNLFLTPRALGTKPSPDALLLEEEGQSPEKKRSQLTKNKALLNEMGFKAELEYKPINFDLPENEASKLYRIQVTDFWRAKEKVKFLKEKGYWDAYREMVSENSKSKLYHKKTYKFPVGAKVLDITTNRRMTNKMEHSESNRNSLKYLKILPKTTENSVKTVEENIEKIGKLDEIEIKCYKLSNETRSLKTNAEKFRADLSRQCTTKQASNRRISRYELSRIKKEIDSLV
jgi:hypothetical protein